MHPLLLAFLFVAAAGACTAQSLELSAGGGLTGMGGNSLGYLGYGSGNTPANEVKHYGGSALSFRFTYNMSRWLGHEFGACYSRSKFEAPIGTTGILWEMPTPTWTGFYDLLVYALPEDAAIRPFAAAGPHLSKFRPEDPNLFGTPWGTKLGVNYGGGVKVRLHRFVYVRIDFREYATAKPFPLIAVSGWLRQREFTGGVGVLF